MKGEKMKQATLDLIKNINENTFIPANTKNELFELFQLDTVADLRKVSRNFMKLYELLEHFDTQTSNATKEKEGIVKFGTEIGNAIDAETWKQAIGQTFGGYVSKVENKEAGKWYINDLTDGKIYKCIQSHRSTSFDITKFIDITNIGVSDKLENLFEVAKERVNLVGGFVEFRRFGKTVVASMEIQREGIHFTENFPIMNYLPAKFKPSGNSVGIESSLSHNLTSGTQGATRMRLEANSLNLWGCHTGSYNVLKGSMTYFTDN
jgi:hypothetical protein